MNHLEYDWESPVWGHVLRGLSKDHTLIRYDARGNGLSDWEVDELSLDVWVKDLGTVVDAAGVERFPLLGISQGCAVSVVYAARHPKRVSHLVLYGGFAAGGLKHNSPNVRARYEAMTTLIRLGWGSNNPAFRQMWTELFIPGGSKEQMDSFNDLQRRTTSPDVAARHQETVGNFDVRDVLPRVSVPTLVIHARGDALVPIANGRALAAGIPGARFVALEGQNHLFLEDEPACQRFFEELKLFLGR